MRILVTEKLSQHKYKTPEGYLVCVDAVLARTGKQTYRKNEVFATDDESEIEVDRKAEEVFSKTTLASFENKPITVEHPDEDVNSTNCKELAVGFVRDVHEGMYEGQKVMLGTLVITDADTIEEIENGEHTDLSCGYDCDIIDEANPQQKNIRGNHVALCQSGRAGIARIVDSVKDEEKTFIVQISGQGGGFKTEVKANNIDEAEEKAKKMLTKGLSIRSIKLKTDSVKDRQSSKLGEEVRWQGKKYTVIKVDKEGTANAMLTLRPSDKVTEAAFEGGGNSFWDIHLERWQIKDSMKDANRLPKDIKSELQRIFRAKSTFIRNKDYDVSEFVRDVERWFKVDGKPIKIVREAINGWNRMGDGMMRKDYTFSIEGYSDRFILSLYAKPETYETTELNAYFLDSVKDAIHKVEFEVYDYETKKTHKFSFTSANASNVYDRLQSDAKKVINNIGDTDIRRMWLDGKEIDPSQVSGSILYWGTYSMIKKFMGDSISDSLELPEEEDSEFLYRDAWGSEIYVTNWDGNNKFMLIHKGDEMMMSRKDVEQYLDRQGARFSRVLKDSVKDATYNVGYVDRHTDQSNYVDVQANSEQEAKEKVRKMYKPYHIFHCRKVKDSMKDAKYRVGQNILYHGKKSKILKIEHDEQYGYDLLIVNPDWDGKDKRFENVWVGEDVKTLDSTKDASDNAYRKVQFILEKNPQLKGKINKQEHDTGEIMIDFADWRNADKFVAECKRSGLRCREGYFGSDTTILVRDSNIKDAKETYNIVWWDTYAKSKGYDRDSWRFIAEIKADSLKEALQKLADKVALAGVGTANAMIVRVATNTKNYQFSGKLSDLLRRNDLGDSNEELDIQDCDYNNVEDACTKDSLTPVHEEGRDDIVYVMQSNVDKNLYFYIGKTYSMRDGEWTYQKYKMNGMSPDQLKKELEAAGWHKVNKGPYNFIDSTEQASKSKKVISMIKAIDSTKTVDRLTPSQYKALRELGYNEQKWKNMTSEEASKIIAAAKQKKESKSEKKEEETPRQSVATTLMIKLNQIKTKADLRKLKYDVDTAYENGDIDEDDHFSLTHWINKRLGKTISTRRPGGVYHPHQDSDKIVDAIKVSEMTKDGVMSDIDRFVSDLLHLSSGNGSESFGSIKVKYSINQSNNTMTIVRDNVKKTFNLRDPRIDNSIKRFIVQGV